MEKLTKVEVAGRLIDAAIDLLFAEGDALAIHAIAMSAANLLSDLVERLSDEESLRHTLAAGLELSRRELVAGLNRTWNFIKHGDRDPDAVLTVDELDNDAVIFYAIIESWKIGEPTQRMMIFFPPWTGDLS